MKFTLREARVLRGITQVEIGEMLGISVVTWQNYEQNKNKTSLPPVTFLKFCEIVKMDCIFANDVTPKI